METKMGMKYLITGSLVHMTNKLKPSSSYIVLDLSPASIGPWPTLQQKNEVNFGLDDLRELVPLDGPSLKVLTELKQKEGRPYEEWNPLLMKFYTFVRRYVHGRALELSFELEKKLGLFKVPHLPFLAKTLEIDYGDKKRVSTISFKLKIFPLKTGPWDIHQTYIEFNLNLQELSELVVFDSETRGILDPLVAADILPFKAMKEKLDKIQVYVQAYIHNRQINLTQIK